MTAEDAWPLWIGRRFPDRRWTVNGPNGLEIRNARLEQRIRCACRTCNNGWMSALEDRVRNPLLKVLTRQPGPLTAADQLIICEWALKTIMVWEFAQKGGPPYFSQDERAAVKDGRWRDVQDVAVGLGDFSGTLVGALVVPRDVPLIADEETGMTVPAFKGTLVLHRAFIAIIADRYRQQTGRACVYPYPRLADRLTFMGDQSEFTWPPPQAIGDDELRDWLASIGSALKT